MLWKNQQHNKTEKSPKSGFFFCRGSSSSPTSNFFPALPPFHHLGSVPLPLQDNHKSRENSTGSVGPTKSHQPQTNVRFPGCTHNDSHDAANTKCLLNGLISFRRKRLPFSTSYNTTLQIIIASE